MCRDVRLVDAAALIVKEEGAHAVAVAAPVAVAVVVTSVAAAAAVDADVAQLLQRRASAVRLEHIRLAQHARPRQVLEREAALRDVPGSAQSALWATKSWKIWRLEVAWRCAVRQFEIV
eukprot:2031139-Pleurochrysis_carterae.AAC.7